MANVPPLNLLRGAVAYVDSMATLWITRSRANLFRITHEKPTFGVQQLLGQATVDAVGDACVWLTSQTGDRFPYVVRNVLVVIGGTHDLYSAQTMFDQHGIRHRWDDDCALYLPNGARVPFRRTRLGYELSFAYGVPR
eukprot:4845102-Prorocentrum_lima.AAC.1